LLNSIVTSLEALPLVNKASRFVDDQPVIENLAPYVAVVPGDEVTLVIDATDSRFMARIELIVFTKENYNAIEELVAEIKNAILEPIDLGEHCLGFELVSVAGPELWENNQNSSARFTVAMVYWAPRDEN